MRVCKVWDGDYPWDVRVEKISRSFTDAGHDVHLVARNRNRRVQRERLAEADVHRLKPWPLLGKRLDAATTFPAFFNPRWVSAIIDTARASRAEVLLVRDLPLAPTAIWAGRRLHIPVVLDMAENYPAALRGRWNFGAQRRFDFLLRNPTAAAAVERWVLKHVDHVLVVIEESRDRLEGMGFDGDRITIVGNTPSLSRLQELSPKVHQDGRSVELIYLGLMESPRGIGVLIDAVYSARSAGIETSLTLIGEGRERRQFEHRARSLGLDEGTVRFLGRVPHDEAIRLLQTADVGVVPHPANENWNTTIPNKLFDYMAAGLAVLTSSAKPAARIVRERTAGAVFQGGDVADCAAAIKALARADVRGRYGANGRCAIAERFHWELDAARMLDAVERVVAEAG